MQTATQTSTETAQSIRKRMMALKSLSLMAVLSVFLLFAQAVEHSHSHDADLQAQFDCEICLKVGSQDDAAVAKAPSLHQQPISQSYSALVQSHSSTETIRATARAPPAYI
jgi:hypothetical protein